MKLELSPDEFKKLLEEHPRFKNKKIEAIKQYAVSKKFIIVYRESEIKKEKL